MSDVLIVKRPVVASASEKTPVAVVGTLLATLGLGVFFWLSSARATSSSGEDDLPALAVSSETDTQGVVPPAPPQEKIVPAAPAPAFFIPNSGPVTLQPSTPQQPMGSASVPFTTRSGYSSAPVVDPMIERMRAPALVVDMAQADTTQGQDRGSVTRSDSGASGYAPLPPIPTPEGASDGSAQSRGGAQAQAGRASAADDQRLSDTERFAARVGGEESGTARAQRMTGLDRLVPQGAVIGAVMETALNSDQPGFARAVTQRDMYSFDGTAVLIPAGSRLIGQYKSGVAQGASRLFVMWTRLIRPDGVSIELASPATDDLGRGGIGGKVNRHFVQRFGGAILTSVLSGAISAGSAALSRGSTVFVGSGGQAASLVGQAAQTPDIPPTITTRQGANVRVFVARDLDFALVGPAR
jgi:type IV secretion system protein VirB10